MSYEALFAETVLMRGHQGDQIDAYLARPVGLTAAPGVVVIHHMPGWDGPTKEIARRFAHHGYVAISPNLHFREGTATPQENSASIRAAGGMPDDRTMGDVQAAVDYLRTLPYLNGRVGIIGYCSGGRQSYLAACTLRGIDAAVDSYGGAARPLRRRGHAPVAGGHRQDQGRARQVRQELRVPHLRQRRSRLLRRRPAAVPLGRRHRWLGQGVHVLRQAPALSPI